MICPNCNGENREDYKFCAHCGTPRPAPQPAVETLNGDKPSPVLEDLRESPPAPPPVQPDQPVASVSEVKPRGKKRCLVTCLVIAVILGCLAAVGLVGVALFKPEWIPFDIPFLSSSNRLVIGVPGADSGSDLYLLRQGKQLDSGLLVAEDVFAVDSALFYLPQYGANHLEGTAYPMGAFIPGQDALLYWYSESGGEITLQRLELNEKTPLTLWQDDATALTGYVLPNAQDLFFSAAQGSRQDCYLSRAGAAATRVLDGDTCALSGDFSTAFATSVEGSETTVQIAVLPDAPGNTLLDGQDNIGAVSLSGDGSRLAYSETGDEPRLQLINSQDGSPVASGPGAYAIVEQGFAPNGRIGYFIMENNDGELELYLLSDSGASLVASALSIAAAIDTNGAHLVYMAGEYAGERTLYVRDVSSGNDVEVMRGDQLYFQLASQLNRIFITADQGGETILYSAAVDGSGLVSLHTCAACQLVGIAYAPGQPYVYFALSTDQGLSLLAAHPEQASQFMVLEDWASYHVLDTSADGMQLLFAGAEGPNDDSSLYLARLDTQQVTILDDDADGIANGLFDEKGSAVLYTALTGNDPDDVEIRRALIDLSEPVEVLYSDAFLVAAQWDSLSPLYTTQAPVLTQSTSYCPGADRLTGDETLEGSLEAQARDCYQLRGAAGEEITLWVEGAADLDTMITLYDRQGNTLASDDAGFNGTDPRLITSLPDDGIYFVEVSAFGNAAGSYTLSQVAGSNYCPGVPTITLGEELSGEMDEAGLQWYGFSGETGQDLTFWVESTEMDPMLTLYDSQGIMLGNDDNNRDGVDPLLTANLPEQGNYCLKVNTFGFETGPFTLSVVEGTVFCPGADTLLQDQPATGSLAENRHACYTVELAANTPYNFAVSSPTSSDTVLELYDSTGNMLTSDDDSGSDLNPLLLFNSEQSDTYYIIIRGYGSSSSGEYQLTYSEGYGYCDDPQPIQLGDILTGYLPAGEDVCYSFEGSEGQVVLFNVSADTDTTLTLYDDSNNELMFSDDDGEGLNPQILTSLPATGTYLIDLRGYSSGEGSFTISFETGPEFVNPFLNATQLPANQRVEGYISDSDEVSLPEFSYEGYGDVYYFDGTEGQTIQIDAFAASLGSDLDPVLVLFDDAGTLDLAYNDDTESSLDSQIVFTLTYTGRYYILIIDAIDGFGSQTDFFYELLLSYP